MSQTEPALTATRWQYLTVPVVAAGFEDAAGVENHQRILNEYGGLGWELVGVASYPAHAVEGWVAVLFFKRPVAADPPAR